VDNPISCLIGTGGWRVAGSRCWPFTRAEVYLVSPKHLVQCDGINLSLFFFLFCVIWWTSFDNKSLLFNKFVDEINYSKFVLFSDDLKLYGDINNLVKSPNLHMSICWHWFNTILMRRKLTFTRLKSLVLHVRPTARSRFLCQSHFRLQTDCIKNSIFC
jgi:hypothetical protein